MNTNTQPRSASPSAAGGAGLRQKALKVSQKITLLSFSMVLLTVVVLTVIVVVQKHRMAPVLGGYLDAQAFESADKLVQTIRDTCEAAQAETARQLDHSLSIANEILQRKGSVATESATVAWTVDLAGAPQKVKVELPKFSVGGQWLGQNSDVAVPTPLVDEIKHLTDSEVTLFQRMNDAGDMVRVATTIVTADGARAIGTGIPAKDADGKANPVVSRVLAGETFRGRALVVNAWHESVYEPIWDASRQRVVGMLFLGKNMTAATKAVRDSILKVTLGETGYVFVLGTRGNLRGRYIVSQNGKRDGEDIWEAKDASGNMMVQNIIRSALAAKPGHSERVEYLWVDAGATAAREKFAAVTYYEPWDWVLGASAYYDEFHLTQRAALSTLTQLLWWTVGVAVVLAFASYFVSSQLAEGITRPLTMLTATAKRIAAGDNTARVDVRTDDEIGMLGDAFNSMIEARIKAKEDTDDYKKLQEGIQTLLHVTASASDGDLTVRAPVTDGALGNVSDAVNLMFENVGLLIQSVQESARTVSAAALEIQASAEQLSNGANTQTAEIVNTSSAVQEMAANTESVSTNAGAANEAAARARRAAEDGARAVNDVINGMERIRENVQAGARKIKRLGERSMEISTIVNTINHISAQTDMLALNAAIEAARAGEHGRGFTVVAEEVRKLAERAAAATQEIEKLVASIQAETNESVTAMEMQTSQVEDGTKIVATAGTSLEHISQASLQSAELINEISLAAKQQVRGANGVVVAMQTVSSIAEQAQTGAAKTKRATESLASLANELLGHAAKFKV